MKILTGSQIREADRYTIEHEPIESLALMERASEVLAQWICTHIDPQQPLAFLIGKGNNGGDGLAMARMLHNAGYMCAVYLCFDRKELTAECRMNLERLPRGVKTRPWQKLEVDAQTVIVDAVLGSGVQGALREPLSEVVRTVNRVSRAARESGCFISQEGAESLPACRVVAVDLPSGLQTEFGNDPEQVIWATDTLTLEFPKLALLLPEAGAAAGCIEVLPIELSETFMQEAITPYHYMTEARVRALQHPRGKFAHKGSYGHALLICGSEGMAGAAVMATGAALRSGCGLVTVHLPQQERMAIYVSSPSAMVSGDPEPCFSRLPERMERFTSVGVGPGLGQQTPTVGAMEALLRCGVPMVVDADGLNLLALHPEWLPLLPPDTILTPHLGELRRLVGAWSDEQQRIALVQKFACQWHCVMVVKGAHTLICAPDGRCYFNSTGNAGMAKGGSGDVLTGLLTGLRARGYDALSAALLGVYAHGLAGDKAAEYFGEEGMNGADLIDFIGEALQG